MLGSFRLHLMLSTSCFKLWNLNYPKYWLAALIFGVSVGEIQSAVWVKVCPQSNVPLFPPVSPVAVRGLSKKLAPEDHGILQELKSCCCCACVCACARAQIAETLSICARRLLNVIQRSVFPFLWLQTNCSWQIVFRQFWLLLLSWNTLLSY